MQAPDNLFKLALARGDTQVGLWQALADPHAAELCAGSGFDWLLIDGEHAPNAAAETTASLPPCEWPITAMPFRPRWRTAS